MRLCWVDLRDPQHVHGLWPGLDQLDPIMQRLVTVPHWNVPRSGLVIRWVRALVWAMRKEYWATEGRQSEGKASWWLSGRTSWFLCEGFPVNSALTQTRQHWGLYFRRGSILQSLKKMGMRSPAWLRLQGTNTSTDQAGFFPRLRITSAAHKE